MEKETGPVVEGESPPEKGMSIAAWSAVIAVGAAIIGTLGIVKLRRRSSTPLQFLSFVQVKRECVDAFIVETGKNYRGARTERGNLRYDVYQHELDATLFVLDEIYQSKHAADEHKRMPHYKTWNTRVAPMMAAGRRKEFGEPVPAGYCRIYC